MFYPISALNGMLMDYADHCRPTYTLINVLNRFTSYMSAFNLGISFICVLVFVFVSLLNIFIWLFWLLNKLLRMAKYIEISAAYYIISIIYYDNRT